MAYPCAGKVKVRHTVSAAVTLFLGRLKIHEMWTIVIDDLMVWASVSLSVTVLNHLLDGAT